MIQAIMLAPIETYSSLKAVILLGDSCCPISKALRWEIVYNSKLKRVGNEQITMRCNEAGLERCLQE